MAALNYIELKNIGKTYSDGFTAVSNINLNIKKGSFVTLLGPSGCGKTTILKMLGGFESVTEGTIKVNGIIINDLPPNKRPLSTVFQDYALFPNLTVTQNIKFGLKLMRIPLAKEEIKDFSQEIIKLKKEWKNKSDKEINVLQKEVAKINAKLNRAQNKYERKPE
jgi:spermidine/putrescine transport system ATP-binding protein